MNYPEINNNDAKHSDTRFSNMEEIFAELASLSETINNFHDLLPKAQAFNTCKKP